ncbi:MAG TPA: hypothetical protein DCX03_00980 [Bacteroidales bacterium]|nr:hypothetical protein [Bacteroidales bacterium]
MLLQDKPKTCIVLPRGHSKSTLATLIYPLHQICFGKQHLIVIVSESSSQSVLFLEAIKDELEDNDRIKYFFGNLKNEDKWTESEIETTNLCKVLAKGSGQRIRGTKWKQWRPGLILMDDIESEQNTETPEQREKLKRWIRGAVFPSIAEKGKIVFIGTIVHEDSFLNSIKDDPEYYVNPREHWQIIDDAWEKPLWSSRWALSKIKEMRDEYDRLGYLDLFYQEYMNRPMSPDSQIFKQQYINTHTGYVWLDQNNNSFLVLPKEEAETEGDYTKIGDKYYIPCNIFCGLDPAMGKVRGDFTVFITIAVTPKNHVYVVECIRDRLPPMETIEELFKLKEKYKSSLLRVKIETVSYQEALVHFLRQESIRRNVFIPVTEVVPRKSKSEKFSDRNYGLEPRFRAGQIYLHESMKDMRIELLTYPKGKHDDTIDALWNACYGAYPSRNIAPADGSKVEACFSQKNFVNWKCI